VCFQSHARFFVACWFLRMTVQLGFSAPCLAIFAKEKYVRRGRPEGTLLIVMLLGYDGAAAARLGRMTATSSALNAQGYKASHDTQPARLHPAVPLFRH
jgi:hypothetical protein